MWGGADRSMNGRDRPKPIIAAITTWVAPTSARWVRAVPRSPRAFRFVASWSLLLWVRCPEFVGASQRPAIRPIADVYLGQIAGVCGLGASAIGVVRPFQAPQVTDHVAWLRLTGSSGFERLGRLPANPVWICLRLFTPCFTLIQPRPAATRLKRDPATGAHARPCE